MSVSEATIAPDNARLKRAFEAGHRARSRWMEISALCLWVAAGLELFDTNMGVLARDSLHESLFELLSGGTSQNLANALGPLVRMLGAVLLVVAGLSALGAMSAAIVGGWFGARRGARNNADFAGVRGAPSAWALGILSLVLLLAMVGGWLELLVPAAAGAARAVDASSKAMGSFWWAWALRIPLWVGIGLLPLAWIERQLAVRQQWRELHVTPSEDRARRERIGRR